MKKTHQILLPQMAPIHFALLEQVFRQEGYQACLLTNDGPQVVEEGLKYVHNDICYPALLVVGQFMNALKSGDYDLDRVALVITQTGGGCRASNYIHLLRKALVKAGFSQVPVISLNFSGFERESGFTYTLAMIRKAVATVFYADELMALSNQVKPYEGTPGETMKLVDQWIVKISKMFKEGKGVSKRDMKKVFREIAEEFASIKREKTPKVKVGIVGEIYVKFSPLGNNHLEDFLAKEDCEVNIPGLMGFIQYFIDNGSQNIKLYGGNPLV
ncbi:MAG: 2-hydroxyglutaryl-CoA dehydratase, partial [Clostridiales bacterium]|nr:2-hydroxyglutaryl-CoA dehydratase [Clostridiales bacterium]